MKKSRSAITPALWKADSPPFDWLAVCPRNDSFTATTVGTMKHGSTFPANPIFVYLAKGPKAWVNNNRRQILQLHSKRIHQRFPQSSESKMHWCRLLSSSNFMISWPISQNLMSRRDHHSTSHNDKQNDEKQRNEYLVVYWKTYSSSPCAKHRHQAATYSATKQQKDGKSALHSYILLRFSTIHFKKSKSSDPEIFTTFSKYVGKERKEKETKSHRDREKHRDKSIQKEGKYPVPLSMTTAGRPAASMATTTTTATTAHLPQSKTVKKTQL